MNPRSLFGSVFRRVGSSYRWTVARVRVLARHAWERMAPLRFDRRYAERRFASTFGYELDLRRPCTFSEKVQWLKLYYRKPIMKMLSDKFAARQYVADRVGSRYLNDLLGVYESARAVQSDLGNLPDRFALKATHGSGWNVLVSDKELLSKADWDRLDSWLGQDYYLLGREWCYHGIRPRLICEAYIEPTDPAFGVIDYKFFCFHGMPTYIQVTVCRFTDRRRNLYDTQWNQLPVEYMYLNSTQPVPRPVG